MIVKLKIEMLDTFNVSSSYRSKDEVRSKAHPKNNVIDEYSYETDKKSNINLLTIYIIDLTSEFQKMLNGEKFEPSIITTSLRIIEATLNGEMRKSSNGDISINSSLRIIKDIFEKFEPFLRDLSETLFQIIHPEQIRKRLEADIMVTFSIIGYYYCHNLTGIQIISKFNAVDMLLFYLNEDDMKDFMKPILSGISGLLRFENLEEEEEEKSISFNLLTNRIDQRLGFIFENFCIETPFLEIGSIIKNLIKHQNNDRFLPSLLTFLPILNSFLTSEQYEYVKLSIQSARHLITKFPDTRNNLDEIEYTENLKQLIGSPHFVFGELKSTVHFLRFYCRSDEDRCRSMFTNDFNNVVSSLIQKNQRNIREIKWILYDLDNIMTNFKFLIYQVLDSDLFNYITQMAFDGPFQIQMECLVILCDIINSKNVEGIQKVLEANFLESIQQLFNSYEQALVIIALDTIYDLFSLDQEQSESSYVESLKSQEWLPETILDLCDQDENDEAIFNKARFIYDNIISVIFKSE